MVLLDYRLNNVSIKYYMVYLEYWNGYFTLNNFYNMVRLE